MAQSGLYTVQSTRGSIIQTRGICHVYIELLFLLLSVFCKLVDWSLVQYDTKMQPRASGCGEEFLLFVQFLQLLFYVHMLLQISRKQKKKKVSTVSMINACNNIASTIRLYQV